MWRLAGDAPVVVAAMGGGSSSAAIFLVRHRIWSQLLQSSSLVCDTPPWTAGAPLPHRAAAGRPGSAVLFCCCRACAAAARANQGSSGQLKYTDLGISMTVAYENRWQTFPCGSKVNIRPFKMVESGGKRASSWVGVLSRQSLQSRSAALDIMSLRRWVRPVEHDRKGRPAGVSQHVMPSELVDCC